jgi:3D (Asp-Asp-Asp) domain-containing protein
MLPLTLNIQNIQTKTSILPQKIKNHYIVDVTTYKTIDNSLITASGFELDPINARRHKIIAISWDLRKLFNFGQKVRIEGIGKYNGIYIIQDLMHSKWKNKIDILINNDDKAISFYKAKLFAL